MTNETTWTIHVAHAMARRGGTHYRARAYAEREGVKCSYTIALDDKATEAERDAVQYVKEKFRRDGIDAPTRIENHGRVAGALLDAHLFGPGK